MSTQKLPFSSLGSAPMGILRICNTEENETINHEF